MSDINWLSNKNSEEGVATIYSSYITLNMCASSYLRNCYRVRVGINDERNIVIEPLSKEFATRGDIDADCMYRLEERPSFCRICSSALLHQIIALTGIHLEGRYKQFGTKFDFEHHNLMIILSKEVR